MLIINKLNNNAIKYWSKSWELNTFVLILKKEDMWKFYIESFVTDTGNGDHAKKSSDMESLREAHKNKDFTSHDSIRRRGLFLIISQLVDALYFKDDTSGWLTVGIQKLLEEDFGK